jgi:hypothetical protein
MISALSLTLNRTHFSKYELSRSQVKATVKATGLTGDTCTVKLKRKTKGADLELASQVGQLGAPPSNPVVLTFDLATIVDADGLSTVRVSERRDDYTATVEAGAVNAAAPFTVAPVTADEMRSRYLMGLPLTASEKLMPRLQPQALTGVTVTSVSAQSAAGAGLLTYTTGSPAKLEWSGGGQVSLISGVIAYLLPDPQSGYLLVDVNVALLPGAPTSETLYLEPAQMSDADLVQEVLQTYHAAETGVHVYLEPTAVLTERLLAETPTVAYDVLSPAAHYYPHNRNYQWMAVKIPHNSLLKVKKITGYYNQTKAVDIGADWQVRIERNGQVQFVPSNQALLDWNLFGIGAATFLQSRSSIPNFWHYHAVVGLREIPQEMLAWIGKRAAMMLLTQAALARNPAGATSFSLSRDGVSENRGLNPKGLYDGVVSRYEAETGRVNGVETFLATFRQEHVGLEMTTL